MNQSRRILKVSRNKYTSHALSNTQGSSSDAEDEKNGWMNTHKSKSTTTKSTSFLDLGLGNNNANTNDDDNDSEDDDLRLDQTPKSAKKKKKKNSLRNENKKKKGGYSYSCSSLKLKKKGKRAGKNKKSWDDGCASSSSCCSSSDGDESTIIGSGGTISSESSADKGTNYRLSTHISHSSSKKKEKSTGVKFDNTAFIALSAQSKQQIDMGQTHKDTIVGMEKKSSKQQSQARRNSISKKTLNAVRSAGIKGGMEFHAPTSSSDLGKLGKETTFLGCVHCIPCCLDCFCFYSLCVKCLIVSHVYSYSYSIFILAETKAKRASIPKDITTTSQLQWHRTRLSYSSSTQRTRETIKPCRVLSRGEAAKYRTAQSSSSSIGIMARNNKNNSNKNSANNNMQEVIQYLTIRPGEKSVYKFIQTKSDLIPFGFTARDGISTTINEDYLHRYMNQESKITSRSDLEAMQLYLKRIFDHARDVERKSRECAEKDLADYLNDSSSDGGSIRSGSSSSSSDGEEYGDRKASVPTKKVSNSRVQFEVLEHSDSDDENGEADNDEMEDLEIPYTQAITFDPDDFGGLSSEDETSNEPIRPGDVIEYYSPIFVAGDRRGLRKATVMSVRPKGETPLILDNGEFLPNTTKVKRIRVMTDGELLDHPGIYRPIYRFKLVKMGTATAGDAIAMEANRFGNIMKKNLSKLRDKAEADGFAPMDMIHIGGKKTRGEDRTATPRAKPPTKAKSKANNNVGQKRSESPLFSSSSEERSSEDESIQCQTAKQTTKKQYKSVAATFTMARTTKVNDNKENNGTEKSSKRFSLGSLSSSGASLGSSLASSDDDSSTGSSPAPRVSLGKNNNKMAEVQKSASVGKKKKGKAKSKAQDKTVDLSLSSSSSEDEDESSVDLPPKKTDKRRTVASPLLSPCKSVNSESSRETPNSKGLMELPSAIGSTKRRLQLGVARNKGGKGASPVSSLFGDKESARKAKIRSEADLSLSSSSSSSSDDDSLTSIKPKPKRPAKFTSNTTLPRKKAPPPSQDSVSVQIIENKSKSKITAKKRSSPSSDLSSSDESESNIPLSQLKDDKASKKQNLGSEKPLDEDRPTGEHNGATNFGGWTHGKDGILTPGRNSGLLIRRFK